MLDALSFDLALQAADLALSDHSLVRPETTARRSSKHSKTSLLCAIVWEFRDRCQEHHTCIHTKHGARVNPLRVHKESTHFNSSNCGIHPRCM
jgi:hypothetical protein